MTIPPAQDVASHAEQLESINEAWLTSSTPSLVALASGSTHALLATNHAFEAFFGWKWGDPRTLLNLFHFEEGASLKAVTDEVLSSSKPLSVNACSVRISDPSGAYSAKVLMDFTYFPMRLTDGKTPGVLVHAKLSSSLASPLKSIDIALSVLPVSQAPSMDQEQLSLALEAVKMGVWEWNPISGVTAWNSQMYILVGIVGEAVEPTFDLFMGSVHPADRAFVGDSLGEIVAGKIDLTMEFRVIRADTGEERWLASHGRARFGLDGKAVVLHGVSYDITDRIRNEQRLRSINQRRAEFLAVLGHELRNPLAPLLYLGMAMETAAPGSIDTVKSGQLIKRQVKQLTRLVDDLLEVSRIEQGKIELHKELIAIDGTVASAVEAVTPVIRERQQRLKVTSAPGAMLEADPVRLTQVISNLLNNASKFTQEGGLIKVTVTQDSRAIRIVVSDNGPGIDESVIDTMFEPFTQGLITLDRANGGLGVGLSIVKKIVELHGGEVFVATSRSGSAFTLVLPLPDKLLQKKTKLPDSLAKAAADPIHLKFLVVEDNLDAALALADVLQVAGHEVVMAHDGEAALLMARRHSPDVILMDVGLPKLDGWSAAMSLRADDQFKDTIMIAMSGYCQPRDYERSLSSGFNLHLPKPADLNQVFNYLDSNRLQQPK